MIEVQYLNLNNTDANKLLMQTLNILVQPYNTHANFALCHTTTQKYMPYCWVLHNYILQNKCTHTHL